MLSTKQNLYDQVVIITMDYLGPAAERFISRQIRTHLHKAPDELTHEDLLKLVDWIKIAIALLTEDGKIVDEFTASLKALAQEKA